MGKLVDEVDHAGFDDALSVDPGEKNGGACGTFVSVSTTENSPTYR